MSNDIVSTKDFYFDLPPHLIAQTPLIDRSQSKLLVLNKETKEMEHDYFYNIINYINRGDCIVLNETKVLPARIYGVKKTTGAKIEFLLLKRVDKNKWETLAKPGKKVKQDDVIIFGDNELIGRIISVLDDGNRIIEFEFNGVFEEILDKLGEMPLPPYITEKLIDQTRYQTIYANHEGSSAAPTAGLHFTQDIMDLLIEKGVYIAKITLHVGLGTFRPVKVDNILEHKMHSEIYMIDKYNAAIINNAKSNGGRIIAVGTTSTRTLETVSNENGVVEASTGETSIFIYPGYKFKIVDSQITNFHLPESTLIMLVSAFCDRESILNAYRIAVLNEYRFFSFGDAMLIV